MKKWLCLLCVGLALAMKAPIVAGAEEYSVTALTGEVTIQAESLNVRSGPSKEYEAMGKAKKGEVYETTGQASNGWYEITYQGSKGYISDEYAVFAETPAAEGESAAPEESSGGFTFNREQYGTYVIGGVIIVITVIIFISIILTVKKMIAGDEDEDEDDDEDDDGDDEQEDDDEDGARGNRAAPEKALTAPEPQEKEAQEDYRIFIDPRYFEEDKPSEDETDLELQEALEKVNELQRELERIREKKQQP